jgi:hypothetical protein
VAGSSWSVDPDGVERVLNAVADRSTTMSDALGGSKDGTMPGVASVVQSAATAAQSQVIGEAIAGFFEHQQPTLQGIQNRIRASLLGAAGATKAVIDGDEEMAAKTQANAVSAATSGKFSAFDGAPGN